jgi:lysophospholipase L1-like esterase
MPRILLVLFLLATPLLAADPAPAPATVDIVYIGDSITFGAGLHHADKEAPPAICSQVIQSKLPGTTVYFSNQGHPGHTTVDFLPPGKDFSQAEDAARKLQSEHPGKLIFSIMLGTNDSASEGPNGAPVSPDNYGTNLTTITDQLLADFPESQVVIQQPTWYSPNTHNGATYEQDGLDRLNSYFPIIQATITAEGASHPGLVHPGDTAAYAYFKANYLQELRPEKGKKGTFYLHPNPQGAVSLGNFWANAILPVLR